MQLLTIYSFLCLRHLHMKRVLDVVEIVKQVYKNHCWLQSYGLMEIIFSFRNKKNSGHEYIFKEQTQLLKKNILKNKTKR